MRVGTIIKNNWASKENPNKYFIYAGTKGIYANGLCVEKGKVVNVRIYKTDIDDERMFERIGYCDYIGYLKEEIEKAKRSKYE